MWALPQCSARALPVIALKRRCSDMKSTRPLENCSENLERFIFERSAVPEKPGLMPENKHENKMISYHKEIARQHSCDKTFDVGRGPCRPCKNFRLIFDRATVTSNGRLLLSIILVEHFTGRLHVPIVGPTGRSDWSVRLVGPTIVSCKRFVRPVGQTSDEIKHV